MKSRFPLFTVLLALFLCVYGGAGLVVLPQLVFHADMKVETDQDPRQARSLALEKAFPSPQPVVLLVPVGNNPFSLPLLNRVADLVEALDNANLPTRSFESLRLWQRDAPVTDLEGSLASQPVYRKLLLPPPGKAWAVYVTTENEAQVAAVERVLRSFPEVVPGGKPWVQRTLDRAMAQDLARLFPVSCLFLGLAFVLVTRRPGRAVVLTLTAALPAWGLLLVFGVGRFPLNFSTLLAPLLTLALATTYTIHIHHHAEEHGTDRRTLFQERGQAIFWSALITGLGFSSLWFSPIASLRQLGFFLVTGLVLTLFWTLGVLPSVLKAGGSRSPARPPRPPRPYRRWVPVVAALVVVVAGWGLPQLRQTSTWADYLKPTSAEGQGLARFEALFPGWLEASLHVRYAGEEPWLDPERWKALASWTTEAERLAGEGARIWSVVDLIGSITDQDSPESLAEALELLPREASVASLISDDRREVVVHFGFANGVGQLDAWLARAKQAFPGATIEWSGQVFRREIGLAAFLQGEAIGLAWFFLLTGVLISIKLRSWKRGLLAMIPALGAGMVFAGGAGLFGWPFSETMALVAAACLGQTTDDGLLWSLLPSSEGVRSSLAESTLLLSAGLAALLFSQFATIVETGWLVLGALNFSTLVVLYVLPRRAP